MPFLRPTNRVKATPKHWYTYNIPMSYTHTHGIPARHTEAVSGRICVPGFRLPLLTCNTFSRSSPSGQFATVVVFGRAASADEETGDAAG